MEIRNREKEIYLVCKWLKVGTPPYCIDYWLILKKVWFLCHTLVSRKTYTSLKFLSLPNTVINLDVQGRDIILSDGIRNWLTAGKTAYETWYHINDSTSEILWNKLSRMLVEWQDILSVKRYEGLQTPHTDRIYFSLPETLTPHLCRVHNFVFIRPWSFAHTRKAASGWTMNHPPAVLLTATDEQLLEFE
jgi:hypothetical protein